MSCQIVVLYYSRHGSTRALARQIARGIESIPHCEALIRTVADIDERITPQDPVLTLKELQNCDGLAMGSPVWFGNMSASLKHFWDQTTSLWVSGDLIDKPACVFSSSSSLHGGQETTLQTMMLPLLHHGMMILGIPYSEPSLHTTQTGGTPYGATSVSHDGNTLSKEENELAQTLGRRLATTALKVKDK
ncbi:NAD(P)H:quinone oxidoreductase [Vibrio sp. Isolate25]|uniref:NAD(P)H:quinone oxidoreductase n=1 Tax=unclassified Vibrio TaxID=2614977 RepID=UPI001EFE8708|nr:MULTISPECIES: NAD(P)H:quinone oxidoreductase [unclassified Vibrio]MCG9597194.1 NAD(P)H:quinone oxidoreductase [Vibrio sp. Isolate25]MCG9684076.1 NAD(P)H:quinone oxidoreductase [Vibrio sp. Isolate23]